MTVIKGLMVSSSKVVMKVQRRLLSETVRSWVRLVDIRMTQNVGFFQQHLGKTFVGWAVLARLQSDERQANEGNAVDALKTRQASRCMLFWAHNLKERRLRAHHVDRLVFQRMSTSLICALHQWSDNARSIKDIIRRIGRIVESHQIRTVSRAHLLWFEQVMKEKMLRSKKRRIVAKIMNKCAIRCFEAWWELVRKENMLSAKKRRIISKILNRCVSESFTNWVNQWQELKIIKHK